MNQRARKTLEIAQIKKKKSLERYVPGREKEVYTSVKALNKGPLSDAAVLAVYREIMSGSLALAEPIRIAYFGLPASFTHQAAISKFGSLVKYISCPTITDVFTEVERGRANNGVVPIENSIEGMVNHTLDMLIDSNLSVCAEILMNISHSLLSNAAIGQIKKIYSHPQVFGQCRIWLEKNLPGAELIEVSSTTKAAEMAAKNKNTAAIASLLAAECYGLKVRARSIEDSHHNVTRFLVIGKTPANKTGKDKTSIMASFNDRVGALHDMLTPFKKNAINLTKIESRPSKKKAWQYFFFIDMEGHLTDKKINRALKGLEKGCKVLKVLGSYPAA